MNKNKNKFGNIRRASQDLDDGELTSPKPNSLNKLKSPNGRTGKKSSYRSPELVGVHDDEDEILSEEINDVMGSEMRHLRIKRSKTKNKSNRNLLQESDDENEYNEEEESGNDNEEKEKKKRFGNIKRITTTSKTKSNTESSVSGNGKNNTV